MKSSTVRRSALSKESMDVIENLANEENNYSYNTPSDTSVSADTQSDYSMQMDDNIPNEYVRATQNYENNTDAKSKEIDLLWQSFKSAQFNTKSPLIHILGGFIAGVISTIVVFALFGAFAINSDNQKLIENPSTVIEENSETEVIAPADEIQQPEEQKNVKESPNEVKEEVPSEPVKTKKYIIKNGDTVEGIIKHEYGAYTPERAEAIMKANNMTNLDHISIDQVLLLPVEK